MVKTIYLSHLIVQYSINITYILYSIPIFYILYLYSIFYTYRHTSITNKNTIGIHPIFLSLPILVLVYTCPLYLSLPILVRYPCPCPLYLSTILVHYTCPLSLSLAILWWVFGCGVSSSFNPSTLPNVPKIMMFIIIYFLLFIF